jgi:nucleoside-diphosphate-sugar epimerase
VSGDVTEGAPGGVDGGAAQRAVLITGGAGFVAAHLARRFAAAGVRVRLADVRNPGPDVAPFFPLGVERVRADVLDGAALDAAAALPGLDGVVHTAAVVGAGPALADPARATAVNVLGTQRVLDLARKRGLRVTYLSTATLYGTRPDLAPLDEDAPPDPVSHYDATKLMGEVLVRSYVRSFGVDATVVRTGFVYGPGSGIGEYFLPRALRGEAVREPAGAGHPCDFTYVADLAEGLFRAHTTRPLEHRLFNVTGGVLRTRGDLAAAVRAAVPGAEIALGPGVDPGRHLRGPCDLGRARTELGYVPAYTLEAGIAAWAAALRAHRRPSGDAARLAGGAGARGRPVASPGRQ